MVDIKTDEGLLRALREATKRKQSAEQTHKQKVSFIMGSLGRTSGVTEERVERVLAMQDGKK